MRHVKPVTGIGRKILWGFVILGALLFFSGLVSFLELAKLSKTTQTIMDISIKDVELSKSMLDAVQEQNTTLLQIVNKSRGIEDSSLLISRIKFENAFAEAKLLHPETGKFDSINVAWQNYSAIVNQVFYDSTHTNDNLDWFIKVYKTSYYDLTLSIKNFMIATQQNIEANTSRLKNNAYRAIMPGIITLGVAILIIIIFFALINLYYIKPILRITKSLENYLRFKIPFNVKVEGNDEISRLKEQIDELMTIIKKKE